MDNKRKGSSGESEISRRTFLRAAGAGMALGALGSGMFFDGAPRALAKAAVAKKGAAAATKIVIVRHKGIFALDRKLQKDIFKRMIDEAVKQLTGRGPGEAFKKIFSGAERVSIKVNSVGDRSIGANPQLAYAIADRMIDAGIKDNNIIIWDTTDFSLRQAGYKTNKNNTGIKCFGTDYAGYEKAVTKTGAVTCSFSKILTQHTDALVNVPVMKTHSSAGISIALKNHYGSFDCPSKYHGNSCDPFIADVNASPYIKNTTRLIVCDALKPQYDRGPMQAEEFRWVYDGIVVGLDPVAVDAVCTDVIRKKRNQVKPPKWPLLSEPLQIKSAAARGLGVCDLAKIKVIEIEV
jgi:uncharacterized protein (DUF362 family)